MPNCVPSWVEDKGSSPEADTETDAFLGHVSGAVPAGPVAQTAREPDCNLCQRQSHAGTMFTFDLKSKLIK